MFPSSTYDKILINNAIFVWNETKDDKIPLMKDDCLIFKISFLYQQ